MWYLSGPIASDPQGVEHARARFARMTKIINAAGGRQVLNPFDIPACADEQCNSIVPQPLGGAYAHSWDCYLKHDLAAMLQDCTGIALLKGWEASPGARLEFAVATGVGMRVLLLPDDPQASLFGGVF